MDSPKPPKDIQESAIYTQNKAQVTEDTKALDEAMVGITFAIASKSEAFPFADETLEIRVAKCELDSETRFTVFFKEYDDKIILLDIELIKEDNLPF